MSFTKRFLHDVFISYAAVNNRKTATGRGLIDVFRERLYDGLRQQGIGEELDIYLDNVRLKPTRPLQQIFTAARSSAVTIAFHSPAFDQSKEWCHEEVSQWMAANPQWDKRLIVIALHRTPSPESSPVFTGLSRHFLHFYYDAGRTFLPFSLDQPEARNDASPYPQTFNEAILCLAADLAPILMELNAEPVQPKKRIFVTAASNSMEPQANAIRQNLLEQGYEVLQTEPDADRKSVEDYTHRLINQADLVVGIEEKFAPDDPAGPHAAAQWKTVRELAKPWFRWLPREGHGFTPDELIVRRSMSVRIRTVGLEAFVAMIVSALSEPVAVVAGAAAPGTGATASAEAVFVLMLQHDPKDNRAADDLGRQIMQHGIGHDRYRDPAGILDNVSSAWGTSLKEYIRKLDITKLIFIHGRCRGDWIDSRLRNYMAFEHELERPPRAALYECEPLKKGRRLKRECHPYGRMEIFRCNQPDKLKEFLLE